MLSSPWLLCEVLLPADTLKKWSTRAHSTEEKFYEPRILDISEMTRSKTDDDGNWIVGQMTITLDDRDYDLGALLDAGVPSEVWTSCEVGVWEISEEGVIAGETTSTLAPYFRGFITDVQRNGRRVTATVAELLGSQMSGFNLDKKCLTVRVKDLNPDANEKVADLYLRVLVGEFSDIGSTNAAGVSAAKGLVPLIEIIDVNVTDTSVPAVPTFAAAPVITASSVVGATGQQTRFYGATVITPYGMSNMSNIVQLDGASARNLGNYNSISGTFDIGPDPLNPYKVLIWYGPTADMVGWLDEADYGAPGTFGYLDGAAHWPAPSRDELDDIHYQTPPPVNQAQTNEGIFTYLAACVGYGYDLLDVQASDLAVGVAPKRAPIPGSEYGVSVIRPTDPQWPWPNPWVEINGIKTFGLLARGARLQAHRDGSATFAVSLCGPHDVDGKVYNQAFPGMQFLLNEYCVKDGGRGFTNQVYGTLETYANGDPMFQTSTTTACQDKTKTWLGTELGYLSSIFIEDPEITWRDVIKDFCRTFGADMYGNRYGQISFMLIDIVDDGVLGRHFRERIEIKRQEGDSLLWSLVTKKIVGSYFWDLDAQEFRGKEAPFGTGTPQLEVLARFTSDAATFADVMNRTLVRRARRPRYLSKAVPLLGLDYDISSRGRVTDTNGLGPQGDVETAVVVVMHTIRPMQKEVVLKFRDLRSIWIGTSSFVGDESGGSHPAIGVGDETDGSAVGVGG